MKYVKRAAEPYLIKLLDQFQVVVVTGPRQAGKSTLIKHLLGADWKYLSFDERAAALRAREDPDLFIKDAGERVVIDEAHKVPEIFEAIKHSVDLGSGSKYVLSGSANFLLLSKVTESLAGRVGILELLPFSQMEIHGSFREGLLARLLGAKKPQDLLDWAKISMPDLPDLHERILQGGFPAHLKLHSRDESMLWFENYRTTYIERDLRDLAQVADLGDFQKFYELLAYQTGGLLDFSSIAKDIGVTTNTSRKYFQILESSYQYFLLRPFFAHIGKRLVRRPKVYAMDTGLASFFLKYLDKESLERSGKLGNLFENWVLSEFYKQRATLVAKPHFYFWRTSNQAEIDLVIEYGRTLIPVEIKYGVRISPQECRGLASLLDTKLASRVPFGVVLYRGRDIYRVTDKIVALPIEYLFS